MSKSQLHNAAIIISIITQMSMAGSLMCFPLFSSNLREALGLNLSQLNTIYVMGSIGQYTSACYAGILADRRGPALLSLIAAILFVVGYSMMALALSRSTHGQRATPLPPTSIFVRATDYAMSNWVCVASYYVLAGAATAFSYFSSLTTACKTFSSNTGLSIGFASSLFGLSPLFLSQIAYAFFTTSHGLERELQAVAYLRFFAIASGLTNLACAVSFHYLLPTQSPEVIKLDPETNESTALLPSDEKSSFKSFISSPATWALGSIFFLSIGPVEMLSASLGNIVDSFPSSTNRALLSTNLVQGMAACNTLTRLLLGGISDLICPSETRGGISRLVLFSGMSVIFAEVLGSASDLKAVGHLYVLCLVAGIANGAFSTLVPSMTARKWSTKEFGRNWGIIANCAGVSSMLFNELYAYLSDRESHAQQSLVCSGPKCYRDIMIISAVSLACAALLSAYMSRQAAWKRV